MLQAVQTANSFFYAMDLWRIGNQGTHITRTDLDRLKPGFGGFCQFLNRPSKARLRASIWKHSES
jgi:hypothetical protein